jgi:Zn-dependent peptidase ImmA (M78 family)
MKNLQHFLKNASQNFHQIAKKTGITVIRLQEICDERLTPSYSELRGISDAINLPVSFLLSEFNEQQQYEVLFRKGFYNTADASIINRIDFFVKNILLLQPDIDKVDNIQSKIGKVENTYLNAEHLASSFRKQYFDGNEYDPLISLPIVLSNKLGYVVKVMELGKDADGASASVNDFIFLFVSPRFEGRMLFTLAHELAHVINHHEASDFFYFDKNIEQPKNDDQKIERFANAFASALLLPAVGVATTLKSIRDLNKISKDSPISDIELLYISRFYGVSFNVAAMRCESLELLPKGASHAFSTKIKADYGSPEKRADELGIPPRQEILFPAAPSFILKRALKLIEEEKYSVGKIAEMLSVPINSILEYHSHNG